MNTREAFHQRLQRLREKKNISVSEVAKRIGVPASTYREWEYGRAIKGEPYLAIAQVFEVSLSELFTGSSTTSKEILEKIASLESLFGELKKLLLSLN